MGNRSTWTFVPSSYLRDILDGMALRVTDWTPATALIADDMAKFVRDTVFPTHGEGEWAPLAQSTLLRDKYRDRASSGRPGRIDLLQSTGWMRSRTYKDASPSNAAVINDAPHAHLQEYGKRNRDGAKVWQSKRKKFSRGQQRENLKNAKGGTHSPSRTFVYIDEDRAETLYSQWILDYFFLGVSDGD